MRWLMMMALMSMAVVAQGATGSHALVGIWQGILNPGPTQLRVELRIRKSDAGTLRGTMYSVDQAPDPMPVTLLRLDGSSLQMTVDSVPLAVHGRYAGTISADGDSILGQWTQGRSFSLTLQRATSEAAWPLPSPHKVQFVTVEKGVKLEVLDWGGSGPPVVLLAGLNNTAHIFDVFAPKLTAWYHVYGITRRGFGSSSAPTTGYSADRLGKDVVAVMDALKIEHPVLIGHSIAGEELSYVGSQDPHKVAGLVYLDSGYGYAFYDDSKPRSAQYSPGVFVPPPPGIPAVDRDIMSGVGRFTHVFPPILAIYAYPHASPPLSKETPAQTATAEAHDKALVEAQIAVLKRDDPSARVVRIPHASHFVFVSNQGEVLNDIHDFIRDLPTQGS